MFVKEIFIFTIGVLIARFVWRKWRFFYLASKIPRSHFDFSWKGIRDTLSADNKKIFQQTYDSIRNCDGLVKTWLGPVLFVVLNDPDDVKIVWNARECYDKPYFVKFAGIHQGSLFGHVEYWQSHRKILDPYFGNQKMKSFLSIFNEKSKVLTAKISERVGKGEFDVFHYMAALTIETILNAMELEVDIQNLDDEARDLTIKGLENASKAIAKRIFSIWLHPEFIYQRTTYYAQEMTAKSHSAYIYVDEVIRNIREKLEDSFEYDEKKPSSFMRALMDPKYNLSHSEIVDEIRTILIAAQDTSALTISSVLLLLAMYKDTQNKLITELYEVLGKSAESPYLDFETLNSLPFLEMVINEALRLMPVVPFVLRTSQHEIPVTKGYSIPPRANILVPVFAIHRSKKIWGDDAEEFCPERFEKENFKKIHPYAFIPFTKGPRMCLGYRYAMSLIKVQLVNFLMKFEVDTSMKYDELEFEMNVTLNISQGVRISIRNRFIEKLADI